MRLLWGFGSLTTRSRRSSMFPPGMLDARMLIPAGLACGPMSAAMGSLYQKMCMPSLLRCLQCAPRTAPVMPLCHDLHT